MGTATLPAAPQRNILASDMRRLATNGTIGQTFINSDPEIIVADIIDNLRYYPAAQSPRNSDCRNECRQTHELNKIEGRRCVHFIRHTAGHSSVPLLTPFDRCCRGGGPAPAR